MACFPRVPRVVYAIGVLGILALSGHAAGQSVEPLTFDKASVDMPVHGAASLQLMNNTPTNVAFAVFVEPKGSLKVTVATSTLQAGHSSKVSVSPSKNSKAGTQGRIVAVTRSGASGVARAAFSITNGLVAPEAAFEKWSVTSYRWKPFDARVSNSLLPLKATSCTNSTVTKPTEVGSVTSSSGGSRVFATCNARSLAGQKTSARLTFVGLGRNTGDYTGSIDLTPDDDKTGVVELSVRRTDFWAWPFWQS